MKVIKFFLLMITSISTFAHAGMQVSMYQKERNTEHIKIYITGLANGFAFSNTELESLKQKAIFCQPRNLLIKVDTYIQMLDEQITVYPKDKVGELQIEPMLLSKLIQIYPCK